MSNKIKDGFTFLVWKYLPSCKDVTELISRSMEGGLSFKEKIVMRAHLYTCFACQRYLNQLEFMKGVFELNQKKIESGEVSAALRPDTSERLKQALESAEQ